MNTVARTTSDYDTAVQAHARYFTEFLSREQQLTGGADAQGAIYRVNLELQNVLEAFDTAVRHHDDELLLPLVRGLFVVLHAAGDSPLLGRILERALGEAQPGPKVTLAAKASMAMVLTRQSELKLAERYALEALELAATEAEELACRLMLGWAQQGAGRAEDALATGCRCEVLAWRMDDPPKDLVSVYNLLAGSYYLAGNVPEATRYADEAIALCQKHSYLPTLAVMLGNRAFLEIEAGNLAGARAFAEEGLRLQERLGIRLSQIYSLQGLTHIALEEGDYAGSQAFARRGFELGEEAGEHAACCNFLLFLFASSWGLDDVPGAARWALRLLDEINRGYGQDCIEELLHFAALIALHRGERSSAGKLVRAGLTPEMEVGSVAKFVAGIQAQVIADADPEEFARLQERREELGRPQLLQLAARIFSTAV
jgi:tetratricopeptide (TPR) repeat protein